MKVAIIVIVGWLVVGTLVAVGYIAVKGPENVFEPVWDDDAAVITEWCDDIGAELAPDEPFGTFEEVAAAALAGKIAEPSTPQPTTADELATWDREHQAYLASSYLRLLEGTPREASWANAIFVGGLAEAHEGTTVSNQSSFRKAARMLDGFRAERC